MDPAEWGEKWAAYEGGSGTDSLAFTHAVVEPNYSISGIAVMADSLELNGGAIKSASDDGGADLSHTGLGHDPDHRVNWRLSSAEVPWVVEAAVSSSPASDDTYGLDETIRVRLTFNRAVNVTGTPRLKIDLDPAEWGEKWAGYETGGGTASLTFAHAVVEPNISTQGIAVLANTLELNGGAIRSGSSATDADLSHRGLPHDSAHKVDWQQSASEPAEEPTPTPTPEPTPAPTPEPTEEPTPTPTPTAAPSVTGVEVTSNAGDDDTYILGETITIKVTFSEAVNVTGTPQLKIDMDPAEWGEKVVDYESGSGTTALTFDHEVVEPNYSSQGIAVLANSLALNGGAIKSASSQTSAALAHDGLAHDSEHKVDWQRTRPNRAPVVNTDAENYAQITGDINAPSEVLVSKPFYQVFTDPDGDELTYAVSVTSGNSHLVAELDIGLDHRTPENSHRSPEIFHRVWFKAADDADWKAVTPALADPAPVTVRLTATDPGGLSVSVDGDFLVHWESQPEVESATITGQSIELTFDIAVEDDPAPAAGQFTVYVADADETSGTIAVSRVSVNGAVVTLALASAPQPGQTVTLDYANDYDTPLQRDGGGDPAPDFTGQAVTPPVTIGLRLTPSRLLGSTSITASWNALPGATSQNLRWRRAADPSGQWNTRELPGGQVSADIDVEYSGLHDVDLEVYGPGGLITAESNQVDVRVTSRLNAVTSLVRDPLARGCQATTIDGFQVVFTGGGVELSWDSPGIAAITGYRIQLSDDGGLYLAPFRASAWSDIPGSHAGTTSHTLTGLTMNHTYGVWILAEAPGDRPYCMERYAFITPFDVLIPAVTGLKASNSWNEGPEQAALSWDAHPGQYSYEYEFWGVSPSWADSGAVRGMQRVGKGVLSPDQVSLGRDGRLHATIGGLSCDYSSFRIWLRAMDGGSYGPRMVLDYVFLGRGLGSQDGSEIHRGLRPPGQLPLRLGWQRPAVRRRRRRHPERRDRRRRVVRPRRQRLAARRRGWGHAGRRRRQRHRQLLGIARRGDRQPGHRVHQRGRRRRRPPRQHRKPGRLGTRRHPDRRRRGQRAGGRRRRRQDHRRRRQRRRQLRGIAGRGHRQPGHRVR